MRFPKLFAALFTLILSAMPAMASAINDNAEFTNAEPMFLTFMDSQSAGGAEASDTTATDDPVEQVERQVETADLSDEERSARRDAVPVRTDRGRAYGRAVRPENLGPRQFLVVSHSDTMYGTTRQLTETGTDPSDPSHTEVIPHGGKLGRLEAQVAVFVATYTGEGEPPLGVPSTKWDYDALCIAVCGCQPWPMASWQRQDPPPLTAVVSDYALELMRRIQKSEDNIEVLQGQMATAQGDIAKFKKLSATTLPATNVKEASAEGVALVEGGEGTRQVKMLYAPTEAQLQEVAKTGNFSPVETDGLRVFGPQDAGTAGPQQQQVKVAMSGKLADGHVVAVAQDSATGAVEFGKIIEFKGWKEPAATGFWCFRELDVPWRLGVCLGGVGTVAALVSSSGGHSSGNSHQHPGNDPNPAKKPSVTASASIPVTQIIAAVRGRRGIASQGVPQMSDLAATRIDADGPVILSSLLRPTIREYSAAPIEAQRAPKTDISIVGQYGQDGWYAGIQFSFRK